MKWLKKLRGKSKTSTDGQAAGHPSQGLKVSEFLTENNVFIFPTGPSKQQVIGKLIGSLDLSDPSAALKAILAREEVGSTIVAPGLALPHARILGIRRVAAAVGICPTGVVDHRSGGTPIHVFVLFLGPSDKIKEHLAFLAAVSTLFQRPGFQSQLVACATPQAVLEAIRVAESLF